MKRVSLGTARVNSPSQLSCQSMAGFGPIVLPTGSKRGKGDNKDRHGRVTG